MGEGYPRQWVRDLEERGFDTRGIRTLRELQNTDLRSFVAFNDANERSHSNAVSHFARRQLTFPKSLLGYQSPDESRKDPRAAGACLTFRFGYAQGLSGRAPCASLSL